MSIGDLKHDQRNPRKHNPRNLQVIVDSLHDVGFARSIVIDEDNHILAGNGVTEAAVLAGIDKVVEVEADGNTIIAVRRRGLTDEQKQRLKYFDNRSGELAEWDAEQLLADLGAGLDLSSMFRQDELDALLADLLPMPEVNDAGPQVDRAEELRVQWGTATGQLWQLGEHRLICGDCTDGTTVARVMGGEQCALVVTDPPYGVEYADKNKFLNSISRGNRIQTPIKNDHESKEDTQSLWRNAFEKMSSIMHPGAVVYCFMPQGGDQMMMMMMMMMMGAGIEPRHELIWLKNNHVLGRVDYAYKHEPILYAWKQGGHKFYGDFQTSVIECNRPQKSGLHPTTKPVELIERLVANSSQAREIVYDPFLGSGTTIIACEQLGRRCRAVEISEGYVAVSLQRYQDSTGKTPVLVE